MSDKYAKILKKKGILIIKNIFSKSQTKVFKTSLKKILDKRVKMKKNVGSFNSQLIYNYFYENTNLLKLILIPKIDKILKKVLDEKYVMQSTNAQNRLINYKKSFSKKKLKIGASWHTDSRYLAGKRLEKGFSYLVIIALDAFTKKNGSTKYVEGSINYRNIPKRKMKIKSKELLMTEGAVCIMDTGMWHKAGDSTVNSRWSIFSIYTGWFVKPYHNFQKFINKRKISKKYKKLLHFYSTPPEINEVRNTLIKM